REPVGRVAPVAPGPCDPALDRTQRIGAHAHDAPLPLDAALDQPGLFEHAQVAGNCRAADAERLGDVADAQFAARDQPLDDRAPGRIGERGEHAIETLGGGHIARAYLAYSSRRRTPSIV